jgi:hypothetical protein
MLLHGVRARLGKKKVLMSGQRGRLWRRRGPCVADVRLRRGGDVARWGEVSGAPTAASMKGLSSPIFTPKLSTHHMHDPGSIVPHIRPKVFTDNQIS